MSDIDTFIFLMRSALLCVVVVFAASFLYRAVCLPVYVMGLWFRNRRACKSRGWKVNLSRLIWITLAERLSTAEKRKLIEFLQEHVQLDESEGAGNADQK